VKSFIRWERYLSRINRKVPLGIATEEIAPSDLKSDTNGLRRLENTSFINLISPLKGVEVNCPYQKKIITKNKTTVVQIISLLLEISDSILLLREFAIKIANKSPIKT